MRKGLIFTAFALTLLLSACNLSDLNPDDTDEGESEAETLELNQEVLYHNIEWMDIDEEEFEETLNTSVEKTMYDGDGTVRGYYRDEGLLMIENGDGDRGVWSLAEGGFLVEPATGQTVTLTTESRIGAYVRIDKDSTETDPAQMRIIDIAGNTVLEEDAYASWDVSWSLEYQNDEQVVVETVESLSESDDDAGESPDVERFVVDFETGERTPYTGEDTEDSETDDGTEDAYEEGDRFGEFSTNREDLEPYGLEGYMLSHTDGTYTVYEEDEKVATFQAPSLQRPSSIMMDGHLFYQTQDRVPDTLEDFTYSADGHNFILKTYRVDLTSGERTRMDVDYRIGNLDGFKDESGINTYAHAEITPVVDGVLEHHVSEVIIDVDGTIRNDVSALNLHDLIWLHEKPETTNGIPNEPYFIDTNRMVILDGKLQERFGVDTVEALRFDGDNVPRGVLIEWQDHYGDVDLDGSVRMPFVLDRIHEAYVDGTVLAERDGESVMVDRESAITPIDGEILMTHNDTMVVMNASDSTDFDYELTLLNRALEEETSFLTNHPGSNRMTRFNNPFLGDHQVVFFGDYYYSAPEPGQDAFIVFQSE